MDKICNRCNQIKDVSKFGISKGRYRTICMACRAEQAREIRKIDGDHIRKTAQEYRDSHLEYTQKARDRSHEWYNLNKEKVSIRDKGNPRKSEYCKKYRAENKDKINAKRKEYKERHREQIKKYALEYRNKKIIERRQYYRDNYARDIETQRKWRAENPDKVRANKQRRRARITGAGGNFTADEWIALIEKYNYKCVCCGKVKPLDADHVIPVSKGGTSNIENIQPLCRSCNSKKNNRTIDYR